MTEIMLGNANPSWPVYRLGQLFRERREKVNDRDFQPLSVTKYGIVPQLETAAKSDDGDNRKGVRAGDFVINSRSDRKGSGGLSELDGSVSLINIVLEPLAIHPRFVHHLLRSAAFQEEFYRWGHGIVADLWTTRYSDMKSIRLAVPGLETQQAIADFLDRETARIDQLIEKKQAFMTGMDRRLEALLDEALSDKSFPWLRFEHVTRRIQRPVRLSEHDELVRLGLYNRGRGLFKKPATDEEGMGDSDFYFIEEGDLIISGQFAWEGAVALAFSDEGGCVVSHRYPIYRGKAGVRTAYLLGLLRSSYGNFILNEASRGSAGRNRPLNARRLGKEKIPVPSDALQAQVEKGLVAERQIKDQSKRSIALLEERRAALITAAVTGRIDVVLWSARGPTHTELDEIKAQPLRKEAHT